MHTEWAAAAPTQTAAQRHFYRHKNDLDTIPDPPEIRAAIDALKEHGLIK